MKKILLILVILVSFIPRIVFGEEYSVSRAQEIMRNYLDNNIKDNMTDREKLQVVGKFIGGYDYYAGSSSYVDLILGKGGNCIASATAAVYMANYLGYKAHVRYAVNDEGAGSGHRNAAVETSEGLYIVEAGFTGKAPRPAYVWTTYDGFSRYYNILYQYDGYDMVVNIPHLEEDVIIGEYAFASGMHNDTNIKTINVHKDVSKIEKRAFNGIDTLENINVDEDNPYYVSVDGIVYTKDMKTIVSYPSGKKDTKFIVPDTVTKIGSYAFSYNSYLKEVVLPTNLEEIEYAAFYKVYNLEKVNLGNNLKIIGDYAFNITNLDSLIVPSSVTNVGMDFVRNGNSVVKYVSFLNKNTEISSDNNLKNYINEIHGYKDTNVYNYATTNNVTFVDILSIKPTSIILDKDININLNDTLKINYILSPLDANPNVTWGSSNKSIVSVDNNGNIIGKSMGSATITVTTSNGLKNSVTVKVNGLIGDMNNNNKIDLKDIIVLIKKYLGTDEATDTDILIGDMNHNSKLDLKDIIILIRTYLGLE